MILTNDIENGTRNVTDLTKCERRIEGTQDVGCNQVENSCPAGCP